MRRDWGWVVSRLLMPTIPEEGRDDRANLHDWPLDASDR
jgi:hypothetical protein